MIIRNKYLQKILPFIDKPVIKVIVGIRRCGKTVLLSQIKELVQNSGVEAERIVELNFESFASEPFKTAKALYDHIRQKSAKQNGKKLYLFLDEIQEVPQWQKAIDSLFVDIACDIYITGSNSNLLSGELATYISGRYVHFDVYPFSFAESVEYSAQLGRGKSTEELFDEYLQLGGLPQRFLFEDKSAVRTYLSDIFDTVVIKDILLRGKIENPDLLRRLTAFLLDNVGNTFSASSVRGKLASEGVKTSVPTLMNYIAAIKNAMIINAAPRYDIKGKALLSTGEKYYAADLGLRNIVKSSDMVDLSKLYENAVFNEMLSRGWEVCVGKEGEREVDLICVKDGKKVYVQVTYLLADKAVTEREFRPLREIDDNFPKYVISGDRHDLSAGGIIHKNIITFLTEDRADAGALW